MTNKLSFWENFFYLFYLLILFTPPLIYFLFTSGITIAYHQINILLVFVVFGASILSLAFSKRDKILLLIPLTIFVVFSFSVAGSFDNIFSDNDFGRLFGLYVSLTAAPAISTFLLKYYRRVGNIDLFLRLILYSGVFISVVNFYMFIMLYYGEYSNFFLYTEYLGLGSYIEDLGSFFLRPAGYFFDYHSQYYIPIIALFILYKNKVLVTPKVKFFALMIIVLSIIVSGIKSAYLTLIVCFLFLLVSRLSIGTMLKYLFGLVFFFFVLNFYFDSIVYDLGYKIITHDVNIFIEHFTEVPKLLVKKYPAVFFVGGQVDFQNYVYSEVYYVTMIFYIGIIGVILFFIFPAVYLFIVTQDNFIRLLTLVYSLSLVHYHVFKISINVMGTTLFYFYFFIHLFYRTRKWVKS